MPKEWAEFHRSGVIHIHDLDAYDLTYNCLTFDIINKFPYAEFEGFSEQGKIITEELGVYYQNDNGIEGDKYDI